MNEKIQRQIFNILNKKGIKKFLEIPDSTMKYFIDEGLEKRPISVLLKIEKSSVRSIRLDITLQNIKTRFMKSLK